MGSEVNGDRLKDTEYVLPVCFGNIAFWLGSKATEFVSHRWHVYIRGRNNEDISHVVEKVTFHLHSSFSNPDRVVDKQPFVLTEAGWGEFEIGITLHFHPDVGEPPMDLFHKLRLFSEEGGWVATPAPVVVEQLEELVFWEPRRAFFTRVSGMAPKPAPHTELLPYFPVHSEEQEVAKLVEARKKVRHVMDNLKAQLEAHGPR